MSRTPKFAPFSVLETHFLLLLTAFTPSQSLIIIPYQSLDWISDEETSKKLFSTWNVRFRRHRNLPPKPNIHRLSASDAHRSTITPWILLAHILWIVFEVYDPRHCRLVVYCVVRLGAVTKPAIEKTNLIPKRPFSTIPAIFLCTICNNRYSNMLQMP